MNFFKKPRQSNIAVCRDLLKPDKSEQIHPPLGHAYSAAKKSAKPRLAISAIEKTDRPIM